jgi:hypothetical protein
LKSSVALRGYGGHVVVHSFEGNKMIDVFSGRITEKALKILHHDYINNLDAAEERNGNIKTEPKICFENFSQCIRAAKKDPEVKRRAKEFFSYPAHQINSSGFIIFYSFVLTYRSDKEAK